MRIPFLAPTVAPTRIAVGVAMPIAHGHATITTEMKAVRLVPKPLSVKKYHPEKAISPITMMAGTK